MWSSCHSRPFQTEQRSRRTCLASLVARMTTSEKSARIGAFLDRLHADMATGAVSVDEVSIEFGAGEPLWISARDGDTQLDGEAALPLVVAAFLQHAGELTLDTQAVVRRRPGRVGPWAEWRECFMDALKAAEYPPSAGDGAVSPELESSTADRSTMPLLPPGDLVVTARAVNAAADVETWVRLLGGGLIVFRSAALSGVVVASGRAIVDAFAVRDGAEPLAGPAALRTLASAEQGTLSAIHLDTEIAAAVPMLWRHPAVLNGVDRRLLNIDGIFDTVAEAELDAALEVSSPDSDMVLLVRGGQLFLAYDARGSVTLTEFRSFLATPTASVTLRLPQRPRHAAHRTDMLAEAALQERVRGADGALTSDHATCDIGVPPVASEPFRGAAEGQLEQQTPSSMETAAGPPLQTVGARQAAAPWYPVGVDDDDAFVAGPTDPLEDLRHDLADLA